MMAIEGPIHPPHTHYDWPDHVRVARSRDSEWGRRIYWLVPPHDLDVAGDVWHHWMALVDAKKFGRAASEAEGAEPGSDDEGGG